MVSLFYCENNARARCRHRGQDHTYRCDQLINVKQAAARQNDDRNQEQPDKRVVIYFFREHLFKRNFRERAPDQKHRAERVRPGDRPDCLVYKSGKLELGY